MSDTTEYCPRCDGHIWYPTDHLGRVLATCERCGFRPPAFSPRVARPLPVIRAVAPRLQLTPNAPEAPARIVALPPRAWAHHDVMAWVKDALSLGRVQRQALARMARLDGVPELLLAPAIKELVARREVRREAPAYLALGTPKGFTTQVLLAVETLGTFVAPEAVAAQFPAVTLNAVRAALANLVRQGRLAKVDAGARRLYGPFGAERQEAA